MNIRISEKHGVNPTIPVCFFCGKEKNEIALLGKLKGDAEAPRNCILNYEPCDDCKTAFAQGILCISVTTKQPKDRRMPIQIDKASGIHLYPAGDWAVLKEEALTKLACPEEIKEHAREKRQLLIDETVFQQLFPNEKEQA